jgi:hypothetical protein
VRSGACVVCRRWLAGRRSAALQQQQDRSLQTWAATMGTTWSLRLVNPDYARWRPYRPWFSPFWTKSSRR